MSWYRFSGPVQGDYGPTADDDEHRRRRKHFRDAGAPYSGGASSGGPLQEGFVPLTKIPDYWTEVAPEAKGVPDPIGPGVQPPRSPPRADPGPPEVGVPGPRIDPLRETDPRAGAGAGRFQPLRRPAPRQAAALDLGYGPVQPSPPDFRRDFRERSPTPDLAERQRGVIADLTRQKRMAAKMFEEDEPTAAVPLVASGAPMPPRRPGKGDPEEDPRPPVGRDVPHFDAQVGAAGPVRRVVEPALPAVRPAYPVQVEPRKVQEVPKKVRYGRAGPPRPPPRPPQKPREVGFGPQKPQPRTPVDKEPYWKYGKFPKFFQPTQRAEYEMQRKRKVSFGGKTTKEFTGPRHTPGRAVPWLPDEGTRMRGAQRLGKMQGREIARREHQITLETMQKQNKGLIQAMQQRGGQQIDARDQKIGLMQQAGGLLESRLGAAGKQLTARDQRIAAMQQAGETLETRVATGSKALGARDLRIRQLQEGMGREGAARQKAEQDMMVGQQRQLEREQKMRGRYEAKIGAGKAKISDLQEGMGREGLARQKAEERSKFLLEDGNRRIQDLEKKIDDGRVSRSQAQAEIDRLTQTLDDLRSAPQAAAQPSPDLQGLRDDIAALRQSVKAMPARPSGAAPIVVQGGAGGGGASSSAGGSSAASGGGAPARAQGAPDLSRVVEAVKALAEAAKKTGAGSGTKGITQARRAYTDKRKAKIAELRALKSKRIREFAAKTKKLPKAERLKQRREYRKKVEAQFREMQTRFPTARGLKSVGVLRELSRKIDAFKTAK